MISEESICFFFGCIVGAIAALFICSALHDKSVDDWQQKAVDHGAAQYNPTTGDFEWKEKVDNGSK